MAVKTAKIFAVSVEDVGLVRLRVHPDFVIVNRLLPGSFRRHFDGLSGRQLAVHSGGGDADALLTATHSETVKLRAVQQFAEDQRNLLFDDARSVVLDADLVPILAGLFDMHPDFRQDTGLFAGIDGIIDGFFDCGEEGFAWVIESEQMPVLLEELTDGYFLLSLCHSLGARTPPGFAVVRFVGHRGKIVGLSAHFITMSNRRKAAKVGHLQVGRLPPGGDVRYSARSSFSHNIDDGGEYANRVAIVRLRNKKSRGRSGQKIITARSPRINVYATDGISRCKTLPGKVSGRSLSSGSF